MVSGVPSINFANRVVSSGFGGGARIQLQRRRLRQLFGNGRVTFRRPDGTVDFDVHLHVADF